jgi:undecaprenyl-diphosphatase
MGAKRIKAAEFSFLMVLPLIFGSMLKSLFEIESYTSNINIIPLITGFISALITGIFACKWMIILVQNSKLKYFGYYCLLLGGFSIYYGILIK